MKCMSLKFGILGLMAEEPLHGYEIKSRFESLLGGAWEVNIGQIYATLQRLERDGLISTVGERGDRGKLAYQLTERGSQEFATWLGQPEAVPSLLHEDFSVKLLLLRRLASDDLATLLNKQRRMQLQHLRDLAAMERGARDDGRADLALIIKGAILHTEADIAWLDLCLDEVAAAHPPKAAPEP
jgi:DNA-binding PadR family transcriptional regulator